MRLEIVGVSLSTHSLVIDRQVSQMFRKIRAEKISVSRIPAPIGLRKPELGILPAVLARNPADRNLLGADFAKHLAHLTIDYNEWVLKETPKRFRGAYPRRPRATVSATISSGRRAIFQAAVKANPNYDRAWYELGNFFTSDRAVGRSAASLRKRYTA